jgi:hypothetical protein
MQAHVSVECILESRNAHSHVHLCSDGLVVVRASLTCSAIAVVNMSVCFDVMVVRNGERYASVSTFARSVCIDIISYSSLSPRSSRCSSASVCFAACVSA